MISRFGGFRAGCALLLLVLTAVGEEHDVTIARQPLTLGSWSKNFEVKCERFEDWELYRAPSGPGHTCWTSLWHVPGSRDIMLSFDQITGPVDVPPLDAAGRRTFYERFGRKSGQWFIDHGYVAQGRKIEVLTFRSSDLGASWKAIGSYPYPGVIGVLDDPQTVMLPDGSMVRTRYGNLIDAPDAPPDTALVQRSTDGGVTWTSPVPLMDRSRYWSVPIRPYRLRDGRVAAIVAYFLKTHPDETARRTGWSSNGLLLSEDSGKTWSADPIPIFANEGGYRTGDEAAMVELPNGDLFFIHRVYGLQLRDDDPYDGTAYQANRRQSIAWRDGKTFRPGRIEDTPIPHGAKPDIVYLKEDLIFYSGRGGFWWTADTGKNWHLLELPAGAQTPTMHQPECLQVADDSIFCAYHVGGDDPYGKAKQAIRGTRLRVRKTTRVVQESAAAAESVVLYGRPESTDTAIEADIQPPASGAAALLVRATPGPSGSLRSVAGYVLKLSGNRALLVRREKGGTETQLASGTVPSGKFRYRLQAQGDEISANLDGKPLLRATDPTFPWGAVGLYTDRARVEFTNPRMSASEF